MTQWNPYLRWLRIHKVIGFVFEVRQNIIECRNVIRGPSSLKISDVIRECPTSEGGRIRSRLSELESFPLQKTSIQETHPLMSEQLKHEELMSN